MVRNKISKTLLTYLAITTCYRSWPQLICGAIRHVAAWRQFRIPSVLRFSSTCLAQRWEGRPATTTTWLRFEDFMNWVGAIHTSDMTQPSKTLYFNMLHYVDVIVYIGVIGVIKIGRYPRQNLFSLECWFSWHLPKLAHNLRAWGVISPFVFATPLTGISIVPRVHHVEAHNACKVGAIVAYDIRIDLMWVNKDSACFTRLKH